MTNYNNAIPYIAGVYGEENQLIQTAEEAAELAQAALKRRKDMVDENTPTEQSLANRKHLIEEIADVMIMIEQIVYIEGFEKDVYRTIDEKIRRQIGRIERKQDNEIKS